MFNYSKSLNGKMIQTSAEHLPDFKEKDSALTMEIRNSPEILFDSKEVVDLDKVFTFHGFECYPDEVFTFYGFECV